MKTHTVLPAVIACFTFSTLTAGLVFREDRSAEENHTLNVAVSNPNRSLPHQAWITDIVGIGRVTNKCITTFFERNNVGYADIVIDSFWRGDPGTNSFRIHTSAVNLPPVTNAPIVFFLTKYSLFHEPRPTTSRLGRDPYWDMDEFRANETADGLWFYGGRHSRFYVNEENADLTAFASNLVFAVNSRNEEAFFQILIDGYENQPFASRIFNDSCTALLNLKRYHSLDFLQNKWKKRKSFSPATQAFIRNAIARGYQIYHPFNPQTFITVK